MSSSEDLAANLRNYQIQLQQVEAALMIDPDSEALIKLKQDLSEVIRLTKNLMYAEGNSEQEDETSLITKGSTIKHHFQSGDLVLAPWSEDGQFYEALIEDVMSDGQCNVIFNSLPSGKGKVSEVCLVSLLKPLSGAKKKLKTDIFSFGGRPGLNNKHQRTDSSTSTSASSSSSSSSSSQINTKQKRLQLQQQREYLKKKQLKKQGRLKELEEEREKEKAKWLQFNQKAVSKHLKGASTLSKKQSIFKSPDTIEGKVGVGTCGIGGKPMTNFVVADKYKRGCGTIGSSSSSSSSASKYPNFGSMNYKYK